MASFDLGQLLMIRFEDAGSSPDPSPDLIRLLRRFRPGGVLLSAVTKYRSPEPVADLLTRATEALDAVPFLAIEEEGGTSHALGRFLPELPSPRAAAQKGPRSAGKLGDLIGQGCELLGLNTNFAPVLDLSSSPGEARSFGSDPHDVARCGQAFVRGMKAHGIRACGKHFPGLGAAESDHASRLPVVPKTMAQLWREDLVPYRELANELPLVKIGVAASKAYDFEILRPATVSTGVVEGLLRAKLGYDGIAVAEASETAAAAAGAMTAGDAAAQSLVAGCDLLVVDGREKLIESVVAAIAQSIESGTLPAERVEQAWRRLQSAKKGLSRPAGKVASRHLGRLAREFEEFARECQTSPSGERRIA